MTTFEQYTQKSAFFSFGSMPSRPQCDCYCYLCG